MSKVTTADCRNFLVSNAEVQHHVRDRYDPTDCDNDKNYRRELEQICRNGANPRKWKRNIKYKVGSKVDREGGDRGGGLSYCDNEFVERDLGVDPTGGTVREFWLEGSDHITYALLEKDGKLFLLDDLSD